MAKVSYRIAGFRNLRSSRTILRANFRATGAHGSYCNRKATLRILRAIEVRFGRGTNMEDAQSGMALASRSKLVWRLAYSIFLLVSAVIVAAFGKAGELKQALEHFYKYAADKDGPVIMVFMIGGMVPATILSFRFSDDYRGRRRNSFSNWFSIWFSIVFLTYVPFMWLVYLLAQVFGYLIALSGVTILVLEIFLFIRDLTAQLAWSEKRDERGKARMEVMTWVRSAALD